MIELKEGGKLDSMHFHKSTPLTYAPYLLERCLTTFLASSVSNPIKFIKYDLDPNRASYPLAVRMADVVRKGVWYVSHRKVDILAPP
jgi:hypothetical protein